jgi:hypothetical protein
MTRWPSPDQNSTLLGQPQHFVNDNAKAANDDKEGERKCRMFLSANRWPLCRNVR